MPGPDERYLRAFCSGDFESAKPLVAEDFSFEGPTRRVQGRDAFFEGAAPLRPFLRGLRLLKRWDDGYDSCWIYDLDIETPVASGSLTIADWVTVCDGLVVAERILFDTAAFTALVPPR
jgi:hypothetical protein